MNTASSKYFDKRVKKLPLAVREAMVGRIQLFTENPYHPTLNNHSLHGHLRNYRSINITGDYRLMYEQYDAQTARLIDIGTHHELYGS